jgi:hypothetical protein
MLRVTFICGCGLFESIRGISHRKRVVRMVISQFANLRCKSDAGSSWDYARDVQ